MAFDYDFDASTAGYTQDAWAAEVACYRNSLIIANLERRLTQTDDMREFDVLFSQLIDAQSRRNELAIRRLQATFYAHNRKEDAQ